VSRRGWSTAYRGDNTDRARDFDETAINVFADDAHRLCALEIAQQAQRLAMILGDLVGDVAKPGVAHGELGQRTIARGSTWPTRRR
jgi:hypothetical protein